MIFIDSTLIDLHRRAQLATERERLILARDEAHASGALATSEEARIREIDAEIGPAVQSVHAGAGVDWAWGGG